MNTIPGLPRSNLFLRVLSGIILFPIAVYLTVIGDTPFALLAGGAAAVAAFELVRMFGPVGAGEAFGVLVAGALPVMATIPQGTDLLPPWTGLALAGATVVLLALLLFRRGPLEALPRAAALVVLSWMYCGLLVACLVGLRRVHASDGSSGVGWVILAFVVTWANDTFAYFAGRAFGKHKLFERISPKKTWEGFAGGAVGSVVGALVTRWLLPGDLAVLSPAATVLVGAGGAVLGPLGDLCESMFKRAAGVKDSGWIIPGHGGLLDRIDALLFVAPWIYLWAAYGVG